MLERLGYDATIQNDSIEALELFRTQSEEFDLIITDQTMPNMTGKELTIQLMSIRQSIPIILCTGYSEQIDSSKAQELGIKAFIIKPLVMNQIAFTIREVLDKEK